MSDTKLYVTEEAGKTFSYPYEFRQTFLHPFEMSRVINEAQTIKAFIADDDERQVGLEILRLLLDYTFATKDQMVRLLEAKGFSAEKLDTMLPKYLDRRLINCFAMTAYEMQSIPEDAFIVYCLDHASRHILSHLYRDDVAVTWKSTNGIRGPELVAKYLATNEFYLSLLGVKQKTLSYFSPTVDYTIRNRDIRFSAQFRIMNGLTPVDFILDVVRKYDVDVRWPNKVDRQLAPFIEDKFWNRYFHMEPIYLFLCEDLDQAARVAGSYYLRTKSRQFLVVTDPDLKNSIDKAVFYKYDPNTNVLVPSYSKLFQPDD